MIKHAWADESHIGMIHKERKQYTGERKKSVRSSSANATFLKVIKINYNKSYK